MLFILICWHVTSVKVKSTCTHKMYFLPQTTAQLPLEQVNSGLILTQLLVQSAVTLLLCPFYGMCRRWVKSTVARALDWLVRWELSIPPPTALSLITRLMQSVVLEQITWSLSTGPLVSTILRQTVSLLNPTCHQGEALYTEASLKESYDSLRGNSVKWQTVS